MRRREFVTLGVAVVCWPLTARAQQPERMRLIGVLMGYAESDPAAQPWLAAFRSGLTKLVWTEGSNLRIELRWGAGNADRITKFAKELVGMRPDAILGQTSPVISALSRETRTIPIVFVNVGDPIASGFAASLARPVGNVTGFSLFEPALGGKWVELLKEVAPRTVRVVLLFNLATATPLRSFMPSIQAAALSFAVQASAAPVHASDEIEGVIATQAHNPGGSVIVIPDSFNTINRELIIALTARYSVPSIYFHRLFTESGGLIAYGDDRVESYRQAAGYIDRILRGVKPADLPVQQPTKFDLTINLKTAKTLGLTVPPNLLATADMVIE